MKRGTRKGVFRTGHHDSNHREIFAAFARFGPEPVDTTKVGAGFPDGVWPWQGLTVLIEVKTPGGSFTPAQERFRAEWRGGPIVTVSNVDDVPMVVSLLGAYLPHRKRVIG